MKRALLLTIAAGMLAGCSSEKPAPPSGGATTATTPAVQTETARDAFQKLFVMSRGWAADSRPFHIESSPTSDANGQDGKSAVWRAAFGSPSRQKMESFIWVGTGSASERGLNHSTEDSYNPSNRSTSGFDVGYWKIDSDKAFEIAQKHGGEKLLKSKPKTQITYVLDWNPIKNQPVWRVTYAPEGSPALTVDVNATTGEFLRVEK